MRAPMGLPCQSRHPGGDGGTTLRRYEMATTTRFPLPKRAGDELEPPNTNNLNNLNRLTGISRICKLLLHKELLC
jgi:hypothetical protein